MFQDIFFSISKEVKEHPIPQRITVPCTVEYWGDTTTEEKNVCAGLRLLYDFGHALGPKILEGLPFTIKNPVLYEKKFYFDTEVEEDCFKGGRWQGRHWTTVRQHWQNTKADIRDITQVSHDVQTYIEQTYGQDITAYRSLEDDMLEGQAHIDLELSPHVLHYTSTYVQETEKNSGLVTLKLTPISL